MQRYLLVLCFSLMLLFTSGCDFSQQLNSSKELVLYSTVEPELTEGLVQAYNENNKKTKGFQPVKAIYELKDAKPDLVISSSFQLTGFKNAGLLQPTTCRAANLLPFDFKDVEGYWTGVFYDPVLFVINQQFARRVGQQNILSWNDLENLKDARFTMENLNNSPGAMNLLAAMACHMGEQSAITYMWNANNRVTQYTKFPFSSIRMVATGEADMTVTVQSMVAKYLESEFPAYVVSPKEGSPANLYGVAVFKDSENTLGNQEFMNWLLTADLAKVVSQKNDSGYVFLLHGEKLNPAADPRKIWINRDYLTMEKLEALTNQWLEKVRFSN